MVLPRLDACLLVGYVSVVLDGGHERFLLDTVQVLVQTVDDYVEELLGILLLEVGELLLEAGDDCLEIRWYDERVV